MLLKPDEKLITGGGHEYYSTVPRNDLDFQFAFLRPATNQVSFFPQTKVRCDDQQNPPAFTGLDICARDTADSEGYTINHDDELAPHIIRSGPPCQNPSCSKTLSLKQSITDI